LDATTNAIVAPLNRSVPQKAAQFANPRLKKRIPLIVKVHLLVGHRKKAVEVSSKDVWLTRMPLKRWGAAATTRGTSQFSISSGVTRHRADIKPPFKGKTMVGTRSSEMSSVVLLQSLKESILSQANVEAIYGRPIAAQGKLSSQLRK